MAGVAATVHSVQALAFKQDMAAALALAALPILPGLAAAVLA
jgi:hypothetical protein